MAAYWTPVEFRSFLWAGFECSSFITPNRGRHDLLADTRHDSQAESDYRLLGTVGIRTMREGLRWHLIEPRPGRFDFTSVAPLTAAARATGAQVVWDLFHYGWPDGLDIFGAEFQERFLGFADAALRFLSRETEGPLLVCPVNESSFFSWGAGDKGLFFPYQVGRGFELKRILVKAAIGASRLARQINPRAVLIHADPLVRVAPNRSQPELDATAAGYHNAQWQAWEMLAGRLEPELGGHPDLIDYLGINYYPGNQWEYEGPRLDPFDEAYIPFSRLLADAWLRYRKPLVITETGAQGKLRAAWLRYVSGEVDLARRAGVPVDGLCLYPILDHPGWDDGRHVRCGLYGFRRRGERREDPEYGQVVRDLSRRWSTAPTGA